MSIGIYIFCLDTFRSVRQAIFELIIITSVLGDAIVQYIFCVRAFGWRRVRRLKRLYRTQCVPGGNKKNLIYT